MKMRSPTEFIRAADEPPAPIATLTAVPAPPAPPAAEVKAKPGPKPKKAAVAPVAASEPMPWEACHPKVVKHFGLRLSEVLHAKLLWVQEHSVNQTMHSLALSAVEAEVDRRIAELRGAGKGA